MKWKEWVSGINRLFVEIWACSLHILWKKKIQIGKNKYIVAKEEAVESIAQFIQKHSNDNHDINECREQVQLIWERLDKGEKIR